MANGLSLPALPSALSLLAPFAASEANIAGVLSQSGIPVPPGPASILSTLPDPLAALTGQAARAGVRTIRAAPGGGDPNARSGNTVVV